MSRLCVSRVVSLLLSGVAVAQGDLLVDGLTSAAMPSQPDWTLATANEDSHAVLRCTTLHANTYVLLFAHTTVAQSSPQARALQLTYPFLAPPTGQTLATVQNQVGGNIVWENPTQPLAVPAARVATHLQQFLGASAGARTSFGPRLVSAGSTTFTHDPLTWQYPSRVDERQSWNQSWADANRVFHVSSVGCAALAVAAYFASGNIDLNGIDAVQAVVAGEYGYEIHIQAAYVTFEPTTKVSMSQSVVARRRSLRQEDPILGPIPAFPSLFDPNHWIYAAQRGGIAHVMFPHSVEGMSLVAYFPTSTGWAYAQQIPNPPGVEPDRARFAFPANAQSGFAYFMYVPVLEGSPVWLNPLHAYGVATQQQPVLPASMFAFD